MPQENDDDDDEKEEEEDDDDEEEWRGRWSPRKAVGPPVRHARAIQDDARGLPRAAFLQDHGGGGL